MRIKLIEFGDSKGFIIPKDFISFFNFKNEVLIEPHEDGLLIKKVKIRDDWENAFKKSIDDKNLNDWNGLKNKFDQEDWTW